MNGNVNKDIAEKKTNSEQASSSDSTSLPQFAIQKLYIKQSSFDAPLLPHLFRETWQPSANMEYQIKNMKLDEQMHEVSLLATIMVKNQEKTAFILKLEQAGIFLFKGYPETEFSYLLNSYCPHVLFPYLREAISDAIERSGLPPLYVAPINFDALFKQKLKGSSETAAE